MTLSYICNWCGEKFADVVRAETHERDCDERPMNQLDEPEEPS